VIVFIDGRKVEVRESVKVVWSDIPLSLDEGVVGENGELHLTANHEGVVFDTVYSSEILDTWNMTKCEAAEIVEERSST